MNDETKKVLTELSTKIVNEMPLKEHGFNNPFDDGMRFAYKTVNDWIYEMKNKEVNDE